MNAEGRSHNAAVPPELAEAARTMRQATRDASQAAIIAAYAGARAAWSAGRFFSATLLCLPKYLASHSFDVALTIRLTPTEAPPDA